VSSDPAALARRLEPTWPAAVAVLAALALQLALPDKLVLGPKWVLPALEAVLLGTLVLTTPYRHHRESRRARAAAITVVGAVNLANVVSLGLLVYYLVQGGRADGKQLILSSIAIWLTNVLIFGLWFWEIDRGGPGARTRAEPDPPDFQFPQMIAQAQPPSGWRPNLVDYLYVSLTNATAFSPTDTMPLTRRAKALMGVQALASLITLALVAARAVNILG
jgi:uncharacterized membrane protein